MNASPIRAVARAVVLALALVAASCAGGANTATQAPSTNAANVNAVPAGPTPQAWQTFKSPEFDLQFEVPSDWTTQPKTVDGKAALTATSPDHSVRLYAYSFKDSDIGTEELLDKAAGDLRFKITGQKHAERINGLDAWVAEAEGTVDGAPVGLFIAAYTGGENNHVVYVGSNRALFDANADVMNRILDSFQELK